MVRSAVFLDRDGVINANVLRDGRPVAPTKLAEFRLLPGVEDAVSRLKEAGFLIVVVTNQPDVSTGRTAPGVVEAMHDVIRSRLGVDRISACFHTDEAGCDCRKPKPGMIIEAADADGLDLTRSWMVGDRWRDIEAGRAAGCSTILVGDADAQARAAHPDIVAASLPEAAEHILTFVRGSLQPCGEH